MNFPKEFKDFAECESYFAEKNAGIFHGNDEVVIRILSDSDRKEDKCVYSVRPDGSLEQSDQSKSKHEDADSSRTSETETKTAPTEPVTKDESEKKDPPKPEVKSSSKKSTKKQ